MMLCVMRHPRSVRRALIWRLRAGSGYSAGPQGPMMTWQSQRCPDDGYGRRENSWSRTQHHAIFLPRPVNPPTSEFLFHLFLRLEDAGTESERTGQRAGGPAAMRARIDGDRALQKERNTDTAEPSCAVIRAVAGFHSGCLPGELSGRNQRQAACLPCGTSCYGSSPGRILAVPAAIVYHPRQHLDAVHDVATLGASPFSEPLPN